MCFILKVKKKKKINQNQPGLVPRRYNWNVQESTPAAWGALPAGRLSPLSGSQPSLVPLSGIQPGFVHHSKPRLQAWGQPKVLWALLDASRLKEYKADSQRRWPQSSVLSRWGVIPSRDNRGAQALWHVWALVTETTSSEISHITPTLEKSLRL